MNPLSNIQLRHLDNGLPVITVRRPGMGVVTVDVWVKAGSADETPELNGISHFLEHMLFKGTARHGVGEIDRIIEGLGGYLNAGTSHDFTHYFITSAADNFPISIDILGDVITNSTLDEAEIDRERNVILEEYYRKQDDPYGLLWESLYEEGFAKGPYKAPVLGIPETLAPMNRERMLDYYHSHYCAENMVLIVTGDIRPEEAFVEARAAFQRLDRPYRPHLEAKSLETVYKKGLELAIDKEVNETYGVMSFPAPAMGDYKEAYALDVLQFVLGGGQASLLYQEIKEKRRLASSISAGYGNARYPDLFYVFYTCEEKKRAELEEAVLEQLDKVRREVVSQKDLDRARKLLINAHAFSLETTSGQSSSIGYYYTLTGKTDFEWRYADGIRAVSAEDVRHQAEKWLRREDMNSVVVRPKQ